MAVLFPPRWLIKAHVWRHSTYQHMCVCFHSRVLQNFEHLPLQKTQARPSTLKGTGSIHHLATALRNGEEMGSVEWVGSKLSAFWKAKTRYLFIAFSRGTRAGQKWNGGGGVRVFCKGHLRWSALTCTNPLYPVSFSHPSHLSCTHSSRDLPGN